MKQALNYTLELENCGKDAQIPLLAAQLNQALGNMQRQPFYQNILLPIFREFIVSIRLPNSYKAAAAAQEDHIKTVVAENKLIATELIDFCDDIRRLYLHILNPEK